MKLAGTSLATRPQHTAEAPVDSRLFDYFYTHVISRPLSFAPKTTCKGPNLWSTLVVGASTASDDDVRHLSTTHVYDILPQPDDSVTDPKQSWRWVPGGEGLLLSPTSKLS